MQQHGQKFELLLERLESQLEASEKKKCDVVSMVASIATIIGTIPTLVNMIPGIKNVCHHLFDFIGR